MTEGRGPATVRVRAAGKINLTLRVGPRRPDGYHPLATVFQAVSVYDDIEVRHAAPRTFPVTVSGPQAHLVPTDGRNLVVRAAELLAEAYGDPGRLGARIAIRKAIPVTGGMAGGSADCAGALLALSVLWDLDVTPAELADLGGRLGADVPFALMGQTAFGAGRGDELVPVLSRGTYHWVLALADFELSTPAVFGRFDQLNPHPPLPPVQPPAELLEALASGDPVRLSRVLVNDLQEAALDLRPGLARTIAAGRDAGALASVVSGSGPTVAFLAASESAAIDLSTALSGAGVCRTVKRVTGPVPGARLLS
nr:4-(cytidine 5'-diphospho)-2-C-methyl-D-erythritol kinase [Propionibacterium sp.]